MFSSELLKDFSQISQFHGNVNSGYCWELLTSKRMTNPNSLEPYGYKVYSQNDEDGIINEIFNRIKTKTKKFIEFGVQDGLECNSHLLLHMGWSGLWIEGNRDYCEIIKNKFRPVINNKKLVIDNSYITRDNINNIIGGYFKKNEEIDLLSIDIDGNDYYVWDSISCVNPRVVVIEYNGKFPPNVEWCQAYNENHVWDGSDWHGASLKSLENLAKKKNYILVGTNIKGVNAFFVRKDLISKLDLFYGRGLSEELYNPFRADLNYVSNHPSRYCLVDQCPNLGKLNYFPFDVIDGFYPMSDDGESWMSEREARLCVLVPPFTHRISIPIEFPRRLLLSSTNLKQYTIGFSFYCNDANLSIAPRQLVFKQNIRESLDIDIDPLRDYIKLFVRVKVPLLVKKVDSLDSRLFGCRITSNGFRFEQ